MTSFLAGGGATGDLIASIDWAATPVGPMSGWPASLRTTVATIVHSRHPMLVFWGPEMVQLYNDAFLPSFGLGKHPAAMGQRGRDCWGEVWPIVGQQLEQVLAGGEAIWHQDALVPIFRNGVIEEVYWTYGYSALRGDDDAVAGVLVVCTENTSRVLAERRLQLIQRLAVAADTAHDLEALVAAALAVSSSSPNDVPYALLYRTARDPGGARRATSPGLEGEALEQLDGALRPLVEARPADPAVVACVALPEGVGGPGGPWPEISTHVAVATSRVNGIGTFVFGLSPRLPFDRAYRELLRDFVAQFEVAAVRIEGALARAAAEAEREALVHQLEAADTAKDQFLATVSHELRSPLNAILGWARMLRDGAVTGPKVGHALEIIERNALAQAQLIEDLLDVSRISSGKLRLEIGPTSVPAVVEGVLESMRHAIAAKELVLAYRADALPPLPADPQRIQQVVWNLLNNAAKFTPRGGTVEVTITRVDDTARLAVTDSGQGIPTELLGSIFDRFKQADGTTARVHGGLGLGLAITRHLVELHGGTIEARSEGLGRGATFVVDLPLAGAPSADVTTVGPQVQPPRLQAVPELQGLTVLVIDDEIDAREVIGEYLKRYGSSAILAASAAAGLEQLARTRPRLILCDISMPGMDGYGFIEAVRKLPPTQGGRTVAVAITALSGAADRRRALDAGFQLHLAKPFDPGELLAVLVNAAQLALAAS